MRRLLLFGFFFVAIAPVCLAQSSTQTPSSMAVPRNLAFEVVSVRENKSGGQATSNIPLDRGDVYSPTGGLFSATNQSVISLIVFAYRMKISEALGGFMRNLPSWAKTDKFDINARAPSGDPTKEDMRSMVQSLLEDRFKLRVHRERREMPAYGLNLSTQGKTGPQLRLHNPTSSCAASLPPLAAGTPVAAMVGLWPATCGDGTEAYASRYRLREGGRDMTMNVIADELTGARDSERPILDRTGLPGTFDFILEFDPDSLDRDGVSSTSHDDPGPTFSEALKEQLGLQLKKEDGVISIFVVDHIEYPSAN
jgi:uncharacterized protein (TIGR03435 family)